MEPPTGPIHLIRTHCTSITSAITSLHVSLDNERIYSTDASGLIVVTSTRTLRPLSTWTAHSSSVLGVQEWGKRVITFVLILDHLYVCSLSSDCIMVAMDEITSCMYGLASSLISPA